ncbi:MAG: glycine cleavage system protein GcvH [Deltaproteobacteria bacterium]|nr:glycine cleavage system protein GcvH [Deltaproteobacteria bacterium]
MVVAEDRRYTDAHEWAKPEGDRVTVGISDYAQDQLGDVVFVELPSVGATFAKGAAFGAVESVKAVSELYMPVGGEVVEINGALEGAPERVNASPFDEGWMIRVKPRDVGELDTLLTSEGYRTLLREQSR